MESSVCATSDAWAASAIASRNTPMTAGSLTSRTSCPERSEQVREALAVVRHGQVSRHLKSLGALGDAGHEHFLFVADQRIELTLRNPCARGDLQRTGRRVARFS